jgi:hypothetical protein
VNGQFVAGHRNRFGAADAPGAAGGFHLSRRRPSGADPRCARPEGPARRPPRRGRDGRRGGRRIAAAERVVSQSRRAHVAAAPPALAARGAGSRGIGMIVNGRGAYSRQPLGDHHGGDDAVDSPGPQDRMYVRASCGGPLGAGRAAGGLLGHANATGHRLPVQAVPGAGGGRCGGSVSMLMDGRERGGAGLQPAPRHARGPARCRAGAARPSASGTRAQPEGAASESAGAVGA